MSTWSCAASSDFFGPERDWYPFLIKRFRAVQPTGPWFIAAYDGNKVVGGVIIWKKFDDGFRDWAVNCRAAGIRLELHREVRS